MSLRCLQGLGKKRIGTKYLERAQILGDSLHSEETSRKLQQLEFKLEDRTKAPEEQERLLKAETARRNSMQYSGILIAIIAFFGLLLMSGKLKLPQKVVEAGIFFTLLIVFEFLLVLTDPSVAAFAQGQPAYHLLINAALALLILPFTPSLPGFFGSVCGGRTSLPNERYPPQG